MTDFDDIASIRPASNPVPLDQVMGVDTEENKLRRPSAEIQTQMTCHACANVPLSVILGARAADNVCEKCEGPWRSVGFVAENEAVEKGESESGGQGEEIIRVCDAEGGSGKWDDADDEDRLPSEDDSGDSDFVHSETSRGSSLAEGFDFSLPADDEVPFDLLSDDESADMDFMPSLCSRRSSHVTDSTVPDSENASDDYDSYTDGARSFGDELHSPGSGSGSSISNAFDCSSTDSLPRPPSSLRSSSSYTLGSPTASRDFVDIAPPSPLPTTPEILPCENESISNFELGSALSSNSPSNANTSHDSRHSCSSCGGASEASNPFTDSHKASSSSASSRGESMGTRSSGGNGDSELSVSWLDLELEASSAGGAGSAVAGTKNEEDRGGNDSKPKHDQPGSVTGEEGSADVLTEIELRK